MPRELRPGEADHPAQRPRPTPVRERPVGLLALQASAGNAATTRWVRRHDVQRLADEETEAYFTQRQAEESWTGHEDVRAFFYPADQQQAKQRRDCFGRHAASTDQLNAVVTSGIRISNLWGAVQALTARSGADAGRNIAELYAAIIEKRVVERNLAPAVQAIVRGGPIPPAPAAQPVLPVRPATRPDVRPDPAEEPEEQDAEPPDYRAVVGKVRNGPALLDLADQVIAHPLHITPDTADDILKRIARASPTHRPNLVQGHRFEFAVALEKLAQDHVVQLGALSKQQIQKRAADLRKRLSPQDRAYGVLKKMGKDGTIEHATAGADVIDWTDDVALQLKSSMTMSVQDCVQAVNAAIGQLGNRPGTRKSELRPNADFHLHAVIELRVDADAPVAAVMDQATLPSDPRSRSKVMVEFRLPTGPVCYVVQGDEWVRKATPARRHRPE